MCVSCLLLILTKIQINVTKLTLDVKHHNNIAQLISSPDILYRTILCYPIIYCDILDTTCCTYIRPSHCKDSHFLHSINSANLIQTLNFKHNFHKEFELFLKWFECADNGKHFQIVSTLKKFYICPHKTL